MCWRRLLEMAKSKPKRLWAVYWFKDRLETMRAPFWGDDPSSFFWGLWRDGAPVKLLFISGVPLAEVAGGNGKK